MRLVFAHALLAALALSAPTPVAAHSLESLQSDLTEKEQYFQAKSQPAPELALEDADGKTVSLQDLEGKVVVLNFVYTSCPDVCPLHAEAIAEVQKMVNLTPMRDRVAFVTVTTDPSRDTADVLRSYGADHGLDPSNWRFLTSGPHRPESATRDLAEAFGHTFTKSGDGLQTHGVVTHVIDQDGMWRGNFHGLNFKPVNLVTFINALTNKAAPHGHEEAEEPSWWSSFLSMF